MVDLMKQTKVNNMNKKLSSIMKDAPGYMGKNNSNSNKIKFLNKEDIEQAYDAVMDYLNDVYGDRVTLTDEGKGFAFGVELLKKELLTGIIP